MALRELMMRKNFLIKKNFQFKYLFLVLICLLAVILLIMMTVYFCAWTVALEGAVSESARSAVMQLCHNFNLLMSVEVPILLCIGALLAILFSHKIAGPVFRLQQVAREVAKGDLTCAVNLRKDDELKELSSVFNSVVDNIHALVTKDKRMINELSQLTDTLYTNLKDKKISEDEALRLIRKLNDLVGELKTLILQYKTEKKN